MVSGQGGIKFGDNATVDIGGHMAGRDIVVSTGDDAFDKAYATVYASGVPHPFKVQAAQSLGALQKDLKQETPDADAVTKHAEGLGRVFPDVLSVLVDAVPKLVEIAPAILKLLAP